jgi:hypothetical protein
MSVTSRVTSASHDRHARHDFALLTHSEQLAAVQEMAWQGVGDHGIAERTGLAVEQIRRLLAERQAQP